MWFRWGCTASCGWHVRCVGVRGNAWSVLLSPCNTLNGDKHVPHARVKLGWCGHKLRPGEPSPSPVWSFQVALHDMGAKYITFTSLDRPGRPNTYSSSPLTQQPGSLDWEPYPKRFTADRTDMTLACRAADLEYCALPQYPHGYLHLCLCHYPLVSIVCDWNSCMADPTT